jgi:hypothetical protein
MAAEAEAAREARAKVMRQYFLLPKDENDDDNVSTISGYCCRGRTKSFASTQGGLGCHFAIQVGSSTPLFAGTTTFGFRRRDVDDDALPMTCPSAARASFHPIALKKLSVPFHSPPDPQLHFGGKELDHHLPASHRFDLELVGH